MHRFDNAASRWRRCRDVVIITALTAMLLELTLQAAAVVVWWLHRPDAGLQSASHGDESAGPRLVLCIGDSFTFGLGATSTVHSYPSRLQEVLERDGQAWQVRNAGWPSRNSLEALAALDHELSASAPALVYVLVGVNDTWSRPERARPDASDTDNPGRFRWRWRTRRALALMVSALASLGAADEPSAGGLEATSAAGVAASPGAISSEPHPAATSAADAQRSALAESIRQSAQGGQRARALADLAALRAAVESPASSEESRELYAALASEIGEGAEALRVARRFSELHPRNPTFFRIVAWESFQRRDDVGAMNAITRALELDAEQPERNTELFWLHAVIARTQDPEGSLQSAIRHYLVLKNEDQLRQLLDLGRDSYSPELLATALERLRLGDEDRTRVTSVFNDAAGAAASSYRGPLEAHLGMMAERVRRAGGEIVFLTYPFQSNLNTLVRHVARTSGAPVVDLERDFTNRLASVPRDELFVADGHLNDRGYAIVADLVAADVKFRLAGGAPPEAVAVPWHLFLTGDGNRATFSATKVPGELEVTVQHSASRVLWHMQLARTGYELEQGQQYELVFQARADGSRRIAFGMNDQDYRDIGLYDEVLVGPTWQAFERTFTAVRTDPEAQIHFDVGAAPVSVRLKEVRVRRLLDRTVIGPR
jgi:lysophospholipase L1-like esterase